MQFKPVNKKSKPTLDEKEFTLIGVSSFNSYFTTKKITKILQVVTQHFADFKIFTPNKLSAYTLKAIGYPPARLKEKLCKQDNYLENKAVTALGNIDPAYASADKLVLFTDLLNNDSYNELYNTCMNKFEATGTFKRAPLKSLGRYSPQSWVVMCITIP